MLQDILKTPLIPWQDGSGDLTDVVLDSRIRLSRNLKKYVFPDKATDAELAAVLAEGERYMPSLNTLGRGNYESIHLSDLTSGSAGRTPSGFGRPDSETAEPGTAAPPGWCCRYHDQ